jgi:hypothetical protein
MIYIIETNLNNWNNFFHKCVLKRLQRYKKEFELQSRLCKIMLKRLRYHLDRYWNQ